MATVSHPATRAVPTARPLSAVAAVQGLFYLATGVWPLIDVDTFQAVTGPKTDLWLVYTIGVLVAVVGCVLLSAAASGRVTAELGLLAVGCALALTGIDVVFVLRNVISQVYLLDAAAEVMLAAAWGRCYLAAGGFGRRPTDRPQLVTGG